MDPNNPQVSGYLSQEDRQLQRQAMFQVWKDRVYRFFYAIWPSVNRVISFFFYHLLRIVRGFVRIAFESIKGGS